MGAISKPFTFKFTGANGVLIVLPWGVYTQGLSEPPCREQVSQQHKYKTKEIHSGTIMFLPFVKGLPLWALVANKRDWKALAVMPLA
jgi:hypothetical protein